MNAVPAHINIASARLPQTYENAKNALASCASIDECQDWADKAAALASYAKQADDDQLEKLAVRIRARAIRRCGELLKQFDGRGGDRTKTDAADNFAPTRQEAAQRAGLSERQQVTAVRLANVPEEQFTAQVESDKPPTISQLAMQGIKPRPLVDLKGRDPAEFNRSLHFVAMIEEYAKDLQRASLDIILPGLAPDEAGEVRKYIAAIDRIHDMIVTRI